VIEVETNLRTFLDRYAAWARLAHGSAMASVGLLLLPFFRRLYVASTHTYADLFPWGSHPMLDPLWSTEGLEFVHDGCEASRVDKTRLIAQSETALRFLRVCWRNPDGAYNCGQCEKCVRTMVNLHAVGALDRCRSFDRSLDIRDVRRILALTDNTRSFVLENLDALGDGPRDRPLRNALRTVLNRPSWRALMIKWLRRQRARQGRRLLTVLGRIGLGSKDPAKPSR
jgi:hypothetical protein